VLFLLRCRDQGTGSPILQFIITYTPRRICRRTGFSLLLLIALTIEAVRTSETSVSLYQTKHSKFPEDTRLHLNLIFVSYFLKNSILHAMDYK
jgi:hypothetical protein